MTITTPLHTDHQLDQLAGQFDHWRQTQTHLSERIPHALWDKPGQDMVSISAELS